MSETKQRLAWRLTDNDIRGRWISKYSIPANHAVLVKKSGRLHLAATSGDYTIGSSFDKLLGRQPPIWIINQRPNTFHLTIPQPLIQGQDQISIDLSFNVRIVDPKHFFLQFLESQAILSIEDVEARIRNELTTPIQKILSPYGQDILQNMSSPYKEIEQGVESVLRTYLLDLGIQLMRLNHLEFNKIDRDHQEFVSVPPQPGDRNSSTPIALDQFESHCWALELMTHNISKTDFVSTWLTAAVAHGQKNYLAYYKLSEFLQNRQTNRDISPIYAPTFSSSVVGVHVAADDRSVIVNEEELIVFQIDKAAIVYTTQLNGFATSAPYSAEQILYVITRSNDRSHSNISSYDVTDGTLLQVSQLSDWAVRMPIVGQNGWLYVVNSNQMSGEVYRIRQDTLEHEVIYTASQRVDTPISIDRQNQTIWVCDVYGTCSLINWEGQLIKLVEVPIKERGVLKLLHMNRNTYLIDRRDVYTYSPSQEKLVHFMSMPGDIISAIEVGNETLCLFDRSGHIKTFNKDGNFALNFQLPMNDSEMITSVAFHSAQHLVAVAKSHSGMVIIDLAALMLQHTDVSPN